MTVVQRNAASVAAAAAGHLARAKADAIARVNAAAGTLRGRYITIIPGQEMIYLAKEAEARAYLAETPEPATLDAYPLIAAEVGITAPTPYTLAQTWANMAAIWRGIAAQIETARLGAVAQIEAAPNAGAAYDIADAAAAAFAQF